MQMLKKIKLIFRVATEWLERSRMGSALLAGMRATSESFGRVLHQLWLEVTGIVFLIMALSFAGASVKEYGKYHAGQAGLGRVAIAICFAVTFAWFGVSSFWRVRVKGKSKVR